MLDEPLAGLDAASTNRLIKAITGHLSNGGIAVIATHQLLHLDAELQSELQIGVQMQKLVGFLTPDEGHLRWAGVKGKAALSTLQGNIHLIGHLTALKPVLSVAENVAIWAALHGSNGQTAEALHAMGLAELAELPVHFLSEGQKRRTALARLIAFQKPIWLLDEPLAGLDAASANRLMEAITSHLANGGIAVIATHQLLQLDAELQSELQIGGGP